MSVTASKTLHEIDLVICTLFTAYRAVVLCGLPGYEMNLTLVFKVCVTGDER